MKFFLHTSEKVRIINEPDEFSCSPADFLTLEPEYIGLPEGMTSRYWTSERSFVSDGVTQIPDTTFDGGIYCDKVTQYQGQLPTIYAHVVLSKQELCMNADPGDECFVSESP